MDKWSEERLEHEVSRLTDKIEGYEEECYDLKKKLKEATEAYHESEGNRVAQANEVETLKGTVKELKDKIVDQVYTEVLEQKVKEYRGIWESKDREIEELRKRVRLMEEMRQEIHEIEVSFWKFYDRNKDSIQKHIHAHFYSPREYWQNCEHMERQEQKIDLYKDIVKELEEKYGERSHVLVIIQKMNLRYVNDINVAAKATVPGLRYVEGKIIMDTTKVDEDKKRASNERTMELIRQAGNDIHPSIKLEIYYPSKHPDKKLPISDLKVWVEQKLAEREGGSRIKSDCVCDDV
ncbi:hypothetical protein ACROYT_G038011 [Oculina patagonica]